MVATRPTLKELTARKDRCGDRLTCPAVFEESGTGKLVLIGDQREVPGRVGEGEVANAVDRELVTRAMISGPLSGILRRGANLLMKAGL